MKEKINWYKRILLLLSQPYPEETSFQQIVKQGAIVGTFIFLFLYLIKPFGLENAGPAALKFSFYFGIVTFLVVALYDSIFVFLFNVKRDIPSWTFGKWILSVLGLLLCIIIANFALSIYLNPGMTFSWVSLFNISYSTVLVGIFPILFFGALKVNKLNIKNQEIAQNIDLKTSSNKIQNEVLILNVKGEDVEINIEEFLFAQSMQNYVTLYFFKNGAVTKDIFRITLTALSEMIFSPQIMQCHRSYIINKSQIQDVKGNAQGLKLYLINSDFVVPVSRKYIKYFRS